MRFRYRFVPHGTRAPDPVEKNELWLDVGRRAAPRVLDHHGGDTDAQSAFQLIMNEWEPFIVSPLSGVDPVTCVLHASPDLDAVASAWLAQKILTGPGLFQSDPALHRIEQAVTENDQGRVRARFPETSWPIVMRSLLMTALEGGDGERLRLGLACIEKTWQMLNNGHPFESVCREIITPDIEATLGHAKTVYEKDLSNGEIFQMELPKTGHVSPKKTADALILHNPRSVLFKELARGDVIHSPRKKGFDLLIVSKPIHLQLDRPLHRYIISTNPLSGFHLKGLGAKLEALEKQKEETSGLPLPKGRDGRGWRSSRSAWYDGRGHHYTIVDSPAVEINGRPYCLSCLRIEEIRSALESLVTT